MLKVLVEGSCAVRASELWCLLFLHSCVVASLEFFAVLGGWVLAGQVVGVGGMEWGMWLGF